MWKSCRRRLATCTRAKIEAKWETGSFKRAHSIVLTGYESSNCEERIGRFLDAS